MQNVNDIRAALAQKYLDNDFVVDKSGCKVVELIGESFEANQCSIFGKVNHDYIAKEEDWYLQQSLNINSMIKPIPKIWKDIADKQGFINSNYGWAIFSVKNGEQFEKCVSHINVDNNTRRACMIYTRPTMHKDFNAGGMQDFMCTHAVNYYVRNGLINAVVQMRSNDAVFGYKNDLAWQNYVLKKLALKTNLLPGSIIWNSGSLHIYERHFSLLETYVNTGEFQ